MKRVYRQIILVVAMFTSGFTLIHSDFIETLKRKLATFNQSYGEERVYLHFDKTLYKPGEDIWYKAYVVDGTSLAASRISTVLYVELIDPRGTVVNKAELLIEGGAAHGDFKLDESANGGLYTVRAFTRWMQNYEESTWFSKQLPVQSVITPRLLIKLDFEKKAFGKDDLMTATLKVRNLKNAPLADAQVKAQIRLAGNEYMNKVFTTNEQGEATLEFPLPADLSTTDALLQAVVSLHGVEESISRSVPIVLNKIFLQFFPEGGDVIAGSNARIAFKAVNEFGKAADVSGEVIDETGIVVTRFQSFHFGMGDLRLAASAGKKYTARINKPEGINEFYALPEVKMSGMALALERMEAKVRAKVFSTSAGDAFLVTHVHSHIYAAQQLVLKPGWNDVDVPTSEMPGGIAVFTLFDGDGVERSERLIFVNNYKSLRIDLSTNRKEYLPQEKVKLSVRTFDPSGKAIPANVSIAVVDDQLLTAADDKQDNLLSWMWLSSEVKGKIEEPDFYFDKDEPKAEQALDYLLMVHGWRRFIWKEVFEPTKTLTQLPENNSLLDGVVATANGKSAKAEVVLLEIGNRQRIAKVVSIDNGQFLFRNVDSSTPVMLLTKQPNTIIAAGKKSSNYNPATRFSEIPDSDIVPEFRFVETNGKNSIQNTVEPVQQNIDLAADVMQLTEVVVTGFGEAEQRSLTGSVTSVNSDPIVFVGGLSIESRLMGRLPGVIVTPGAQPGSNSNLQIRGVSTFVNRSEPLWVIDGVPMEPGVNSNFPIGAQLNSETIKAIHVLSAVEATALYGSRALNGVILVNTQSRPDGRGFDYVWKKPQYSVLNISPRKYSISREFYTPAVKADDVRSDFNTTVTWRHTVVTNKNGEAEIEFNNNEAVSAFRITAEGIDGAGLIGRAEQTYHTLLPFTLDARMPTYLGFEDTLRLPVRVTNNTKGKLSGSVKVTIPTGLRIIDEVPGAIEVESGQTKTFTVPVVADGVRGEFPFSVRLENDHYKDEIKQTINVTPVGFPVTASFSGQQMSKSMSFDMRDVEKGSVTGELMFVNDVLDDLFISAEGMMREPYGCFEQVSSSTFPNILALQLLKQTGRSNKQVEQKALKFINDGYKKLAGYEISTGGFDWFGNPPAHEGLTAFGLLEFYEMKKVYPNVSEAMLQRTIKWLLSRRSLDGTFVQKEKGLHGWSANEVSNAYIVYALSEIAVKDLETEYNRSFSEAKKSGDMYISALMANAALNFGRYDDFNQLLADFKAAVNRDGLAKLKSRTSVTYSYGNSLINETVAMWALALMKEPGPDLNLINQCVRFVGARKSFGVYGSTQATYLALKAITEYHKLVTRVQSGGEITVVAGSNSITKAYSANQVGPVVFDEFIQQLKTGNNTVSFAFGKTTEAIPASFRVSWNTKKPQSSDSCWLAIETKLMQDEITLNETTRLTVRLMNKSDNHVPMSMAVVGIPAGLSVQLWQLKELHEKKVFDFYEITNNKLVLYYRSLNANEVKEVNLDLKADLPGTFQAAASCAYLYYTNEYRHWVAGTKVKVR